ncbi:MAG TPA: monovalent cation:proton antiporter-2 (CPA2) family protein [Stenotrophobium sp.]|nr:monovalent cation:proton antiporter-2 (CPA2) family protein [Stenotrophobium sp.]
MLLDITIFLAAAVLFVPIFRRLGFGAVLGYLAAGIVIGPWGCGLIRDVASIYQASELGIVLLLFIIGLELQPSRLWTLRRTVFGLGATQVAATAVLLAAAVHLYGLNPAAALVVGFGLAMSSTAFVLQMLSERKEIATRQGRAAFAVLLFQDISVIPFMALIPLLAMQVAQAGGTSPWIKTAETLAVFALVVFGGRYAVRPLFRALAMSQVPEIFTAAALLIVLGTAMAMAAVGLSMSLGAFLAGVLLADSEYRHELQADIEPFKGLLLGLFFMAIGMTANLGLLLHHPLLVLELTVALLLLKALVLYGVGRLARLPPGAAAALACALPQGGEFAFVLFGVAVTAGVITAAQNEMLVVVITLSMIVTPLLYAVQVRFRRQEAPPPYDTIDAPENDVIIAGFGPFGQIVGRMLRVKKIRYTVLEKDPSQVDFVRRFGTRVYYGDAGRIEMLRAAHADKARIFVLTIPEEEASLHIATTVRRHFPQLRIFAVARTRHHALRLMDMGIADVIRRSYYSSLEMARELLQAVGETEPAARRAVEVFRETDQRTLLSQRAVFHDEQAMMQSAQDAARELEQLFEADHDAGSGAAQESSSGLSKAL